MPIHGFKTKSNSLAELNEKFGAIEKAIQTRAEKKYNELLGREIALWADLVTLNAVTLQDDCSIFERAVRSLAEKMFNASTADLYGVYNFRVYAHVVSFDDETYIHVLCAQEELLKPFARAFEPCSVNDGLKTKEDDEKSAENEKLWQRIEETYKGRSLFGIDLTPHFTPDIDKVKYPPLAARCEMQARHQILNSLLSKMSGDAPIQPYMLMPLIDDAYDMIVGREYRTDSNIKSMQLAGILIDLKKNKTRIIGEDTDETVQTGEILEAEPAEDAEPVTEPKGNVDIRTKNMEESKYIS